MDAIFEIVNSVLSGILSGLILDLLVIGLHVRLLRVGVITRTTKANKVYKQPHKKQEMNSTKIKPISKVARRLTPVVVPANKTVKTKPPKSLNPEKYTPIAVPLHETVEIKPPAYSTLEKDTPTAGPLHKTVKTKPLPYSTPEKDTPMAVPHYKTVEGKTPTYLIPKEDIPSVVPATFEKKPPNYSLQENERRLVPFVKMSPVVDLLKKQVQSQPRPFKPRDSQPIGAKVRNTMAAIFKRKRQLKPRLFLQSSLKSPYAAFTIDKFRALFKKNGPVKRRLFIEGATTDPDHPKEDQLIGQIEKDALTEPQMFNGNKISFLPEDLNQIPRSGPFEKEIPLNRRLIRDEEGPSQQATTQENIQTGLFKKEGFVERRPFEGKGTQSHSPAEKKVNILHRLFRKQGPVEPRLFNLKGKETSAQPEPELKVNTFSEFYEKEKNVEQIRINKKGTGVTNLSNSLRKQLEGTLNTISEEDDLFIQLDATNDNSDEVVSQWVALVDQDGVLRTRKFDRHVTTTNKRDLIVKTLLADVFGKGIPVKTHRSKKTKIKARVLKKTSSKTQRPVKNRLFKETQTESPAASVTPKTWNHLSSKGTQTLPLFHQASSAETRLFINGRKPNSLASGQFSEHEPEPKHELKYDVVSEPVAEQK